MLSVFKTAMSMCLSCFEASLVSTHRLFPRIACFCSFIILLTCHTSACTASVFSTLLQLLPTCASTDFVYHICCRCEQRNNHCGRVGCVNCSGNGRCGRRLLLQT